MKTFKLLTVFIIFSVVLIVTTNAMAEKGTEFLLEDPCEFFEPPANGTDTEMLCGVHQGAGYRIEVPVNWNGDLLMWAHGYRMNNEWLWVDDPPFREWLVANGYAWAASSFTTSKLDVTDGMKATKALVALFEESVGIPAHIYISGQSMGGAVTVSSIEQWPDLYDGGMPTCGSLTLYAGFDTYLDFYVLSNALAGTTATYPIPEDYASAGYPSVVNHLAGAPGYFPYLLNSQGIQLKDAFELRTGGQRPVFDQAFVFWYGIAEIAYGFSLTQFFIDLEPIGVKGVWVDNQDTIYQFDTDPDLSADEISLNESVLRIQRDPQSLHSNGLKNVPYNDGKIKVPVLSLHNLGDLLVPFSAEQIYAQRVAEQGASELLVQRAIRDLQHCYFTEDEYATAFSDLVNWVESGIKPAGDDLLNPVVVSEPDFGCAFTSEDRDYGWISPMLTIPACP